MSTGGGHAWQGGVHGGECMGVCGKGPVWQEGMWGAWVGGGLVCVWQECAWQGVCMAGGMHGRVACVGEETAIAVDGTHPTGMHSCF